MTDDAGSKWLSVGRLQNLLSELPSDAKIYPNRVNNLAVYGIDDKWLGFIDFLREGSFEEHEGTPA